MCANTVSDPAVAVATSIPKTYKVSTFVIHKIGFNNHSI